METKHAPESAPAALGRCGEAEDGWEGQAVLLRFWPGMLWLSPWVELWATMWVGLLRQGLAWQPGVVPHPGHSEPLPTGSPPWTSKAETAVIPLHRRTASSGRRPDGISMRLEIPNPPWIGGGNIIAIDAVVPRTRQRECQAGDSGPDRGM